MSVCRNTDSNEFWKVGRVPLVCQPFAVPSGLLVSHNGSVLNVTGLNVIVEPCCFQNQPYIFEFNVPALQQTPPMVSAATLGWQRYAHMAEYSRSLPVFVSAISFGLTIVVAMACSISGPNYRKYPVIVHIAVYYALVHMLVVFSISLQAVSNQYYKGQSSTHLLSTQIVTRPVEVATYVSEILVLLAQARVAVELFDRRSEKRLALALALQFICVVVVLWGFWIFYDPCDIVAWALEYLFELSLYILFACSVILKAITSRQAAFTRSNVALTVLSITVSLMSSCFYVADLAGWWVGRLLDQMCQISNIVNIVVIYYWTQVIKDTEQMQEAEKILGRRLYNEEQGQRNYFFKDEDEESSEDSDSASSEPDHRRRRSGPVTSNAGTPLGRLLDYVRPSSL